MKPNHMISCSEYQLLMMINIADCCYICLHTPLNKALTLQNQEIGFKDHVQHSRDCIDWLEKLCFRDMKMGHLR